MNSSTPQKSKGKYNKNCSSFFGINLDQESAFLDTRHLCNFISSQLSKRVLSPKPNNIDTVVMLQQTEDATKIPIDTPREVSFLEEYNEGNVKPTEILGNNLSDLRASVPLKMSTPRVKSMKELSMNEATTPYSSGDEIVLCPSPSSFLQEINCLSSTPLQSISKENVGNREKLRNYDQNIDLSVSRRLYQSLNRNNNVRESSVSVELYHKDSEKCKSPLKMFPSYETCQNTDIILDKEVDYKMAGNPFSVMAKHCSSSMLPEQSPASTQGIGKFPEGKFSANCPNLSMVSEIVFNTTVNECTVPGKDSAISNLVEECETADEDKLILSLCNMSVNKEISPADNKDETYVNMITVDEASDSSDSSGILREASDDRCRTQIRLEGESRHLLDSEACNNINNEEPPPSIKKVHASSSKAEGEGLEEPVKAYMLPFVSSDPQENRDNEDPQWSFLAKLETDEERYQLTRKLWKSIVVPDPNVDMTYFGCLRRWRAQRNASQDVSNMKRTALSQKRKSRPEDDVVGQPPKKRARGVMDVSFSLRRFEESMRAVTINYMEERSRSNLSHQQVWKLERTYQEKMHQLTMACSEVEALHKFYHGLPDQDLSVSQASVEAEQREIEQLYERFKQIYGWDGRAFIP